MSGKKGSGGGLVKAEAIPAMKTLAKKFAPPTRAQLSLIEAVAGIQERPPGTTELAFMARQLVLCTLPHSDPGNVEAWTRRTGSIALTLQRGWDSKAGQSIGYPYGIIPRLMLFWIVTEALQTGSRRLVLGHSLAEFMREVGLDPSRGGKRSDHARIKEQMRRLFRCHITFDGGDDERDRWKDMNVAPEGEFWWSHKEPEQGSLWSSWIELGEKFFEAILESPVPIDKRALRALKRSPLALDLYAWVCFRAFVIVKKKQEPQFVPWSRLMQQLGGDYTNVDEFARKAKAALRKVALAARGVSIGTVKGGFMLHGTGLAVPQGSAKLVG
jgi:hypothetical protein